MWVLFHRFSRTQVDTRTLKPDLYLPTRTTEACLPQTLFVNPLTGEVAYFLFWSKLQNDDR
jgi:hypothetical protein